nr:reverse transcriptase domain-containing protein [Tanacetum cinerariifolium]
MKGYYDAKVRGVSFRPVDFVYRANGTSHAEDAGKLGPKWEGPYELLILKAVGMGAVVVSIGSDDKKVEKKDDEKKRDMSKVKCYNCKKEGHFAKDCKKAKVKDYNYYKTKMLLAKKDSDEQVLLAEDQARMESNSDSDQEINANMVFMAQIE